MQEEFDLRYHDVKLLMKNYRMLKKHYAHISPEMLEVNAILFNASQNVFDNVACG